jgi:hypothetical protein
MTAIHRTWSLDEGGRLTLAMYDVAEERGYRHSASGFWPSTPLPGLVPGLADDEELVFSYAYRKSFDYVVDLGYAVAFIEVEDGNCRTTTYSDSIDGAQRAKARVEELQPKTEPKDALSVPFNFWSYGRGGPQVVRREIEGIEPDSIRGNYSDDVQAELDRLCDPEWRPDGAGQLLLWSGPPGTGKTHAIRALAKAWKPWCGMHYVTDPEKFFGSQADYMVSVLLRNAGIEDEEDGQQQWSLLVLEDAGDFLQPDAKQETGGPALARFLNVVDGLIGHGLKVMVLVTTNEEVKELHEAVSRPGRCAADVRFGKLSTEESHRWLQEHRAHPDVPAGNRTLAELYAAVNDTDRRSKKATTVGFGA